MAKATNASLSVETSGSVMMSVFLENTSPREVTPILLNSYPDKSSALELLVLGDFQKLSGNLHECGHFIKAGDQVGDCMPEMFRTYAEYEETINKCTYGFNYIFKDDCWFQFIAGKKPTYKILKRKKHGKES